MAQNLNMLLRRVLETPGDEPLLEQLRGNAAGILAGLKSGEVTMPDLPDDGDDRRRQWVAMVFETIADQEPLSETDQEMLDLLDRAYAAGDDEIEEGFDLLSQPQLEKPVDKLATALQEARGQLLNPATAEWLERNTLATLTFDACQSVSRLVEYLVGDAETPVSSDEPGADNPTSPAVAEFVRQYRERKRKIDDPYVAFLSLSARARFQPAAPPDMVLAEISRTAECPPTKEKHFIEKRLFDWLLAAAQLRPYLFPGFLAVEVAGSLGLIPLPATDSAITLVERWGWGEVQSRHKALLRPPVVVGAEAYA